MKAPHDNSTVARLDERARQNPTGRSATELLDDILAAYAQVDPSDPDAKRLRTLFLNHLDAEANHEERARYGRFLATEIEPDDLDVLQFDDAEQAVAVFERLHRFPYESEEHSARARAHGEHLLQAALLRFENQDNFEGMFELLQIAPPTLADNHEILRLKTRARLFEERRTRRRRGVLYGYLALQAMLVLLVFPLLFINAENGKIQDEIQSAVDIDIESSTARQTVSFTDGVYWSVITAASIGYGDITPRTTVGRAIAATLGTMGVITIGVVAGLVLSWISPRRLD